MDVETEYWKQLAMSLTKLYEKSFQDLLGCWSESWRLESKIIKWQAISEILFLILLAETLYLILK